jgi:Putative Ig domain/Cadherin-like/Domain of unknown function (DUF4114)/WD40-like Beta Propeller Repeat
MAPIIDRNNITATGTTEVVVTNDMLQATSTGIGESQLLFTVNSLPSQGGLKLNGTTLAVGASFTQADITARKLTYLPSGTASTTDGFGFTVTDGTTTPGVPAALPKIIFSPEFSSTTSNLHSAFYGNPVFSADGRYILAGGDTSYPSTGAAKGQLGLFLYDLQNTSIERIAVQTSNPNANTPFAQSFDISRDGRYITFESSDPNLAVGDTDTAPKPDIFLFDRQTGINKIISVGSKGEKEARASKLPSISSDGRYIAFESEASYLVANDANGSIPDIFVYDSQTATTEKVSQGFATGYAHSSAISANGRYVVFNSNAGLAPNNLGDEAVYVRDRQTGTLEKVSVNSSGVAANSASGDYLDHGRMDAAVISGDGRYVVFKSNAMNLVAGDTNGLNDVFVRDRQTGTTQRVSLDKDGNQLSDGSYDYGFYNLQLSEDGRYLSFNSKTPNLVAGDTLKTDDVFIRDLQTGTTTRVANYNVATDSDGNINDHVAISRDARYVAARNVDIVPPGYRTNNLYFTDRGTTGSISSTSANAAITITPVVNPSTNNAPVVANSIATQTAVSGMTFSLSVPANTFSDPDAGDTLGYSATRADGTALPSWLTFNTTTGTFSGIPAAADVGSLSVLVRATDRGGLSVTNTFGLSIETTFPNPNPTTLSPIPGLSLKSNLFNTDATIAGFSIQALSQKASNKVNQIVMFAVDDATGKIGTLLPGAPGYLQAALAIAKPIFSTLGGNFFSTDPQQVAFNPNAFHQLIEIQDASISDLQQQLTKGITPTNVLYSAPDANGNSPIKVTENSTKDGYQISINGDELVLGLNKLAGGIFNPPIGSKSQTLPEGRTIDLTNYADRALKVDLNTKSDALFNNNIGFYAVEDAAGTIKLADGSSIGVGDSRYAAEAVKKAIANAVLSANKTDTKTGQNITGGSLYAPVAISQGSLNDFVNINPTNGGGGNNIHAYFNYLGANPDKVDHFRLLGANTFGFEDIYGGGDRDFNDVVINLKIST